MSVKTEKTSLACIILAAGKGSRMKTNLPKVLHSVAGKPMLFQVIDTARTLHPEKIITVVASDMQELGVLLKQQKFGSEIAIQSEQLGTGHAVKAAFDKLKGFNGDILLLYGDTPLVRAETLSLMLSTLRAKNSPGLVMLGMQCKNPGAYGRIIMDKHGYLESIVEAADATPAQLQINLCNAGMIAAPAKKMLEWLGKVKNKNAQQEYYVTDIIPLARKEKLRCALVVTDEQECQGVNTREHLAEANRIMQERLRKKAMDGGATLVDPSSVYLCTDTKLGRDVVVHPHVVFGPGVTIAQNAEIRSFSHIEGARIAANTVIGPFARLRPGSVIGESAHVGNFVEIKQATLERGAKANHLSYIGDAFVGEKANIGAGTITCNYDGYNKHRTDIGAGAFIGSNTALVAPVSIGEGAIIGAGSVITEDVESDALAMTRATQKQKLGWAKVFRNRKNN